MGALQEAYLTGFLVDFLTFITMRTVWRTIYDSIQEEKGELDHE